MGKINQGILGAVSGTIGNVVGSTWRGIACLRIKAQSHNDANSEVQQLNRSRFLAIQKFEKQIMDTIIRPIWNRKAVKMTGCNLFFKTNRDAFDANGQNVDYGKLQMTTGYLPAVNFTEFQLTPNTEREYHVTWEDNSGVGAASSTDQLQVVFLSESGISYYAGNAIARSQGQGTITLPGDAGQIINLYFYFQNAAKNMFSDSTYRQVQLPNN